MKGKRNPRAADPPIDNVKTPQYLVLVSENFMEARVALSRPGITSLPANQSPVKMDIAPVAPVTGPPPTTIQSGPRINSFFLSDPGYDIKMHCLWNVLN